MMRPHSLASSASRCCRSMSSIGVGTSGRVAMLQGASALAIFSTGRRRCLVQLKAVGSSDQQEFNATLEEKVSAMISRGVCHACHGSGRIPCKACNGSGRLSRAGYNKKTTLPKEIINSKWTAMEETVGWRHFRVMEQRKTASQQTFLLMQASCDPMAQLWVNKDSLRDRSRWSAGWLQMSLVGGKGPDGEIMAVPKDAGRPCRSCSSSGIQVCPACDASGAALINI